MKLVNGQRLGWWFQMLTVLALLFGLYMQHDSLKEDAQYVKSSDNLLSKFRESYQEAQNDETRNRLVNGFVDINLNADKHELKGMQEYQSQSEMLLMLVIGVNLLDIVSVLCSKFAARKSPKNV
jgi:hypothetical protein